MNAGSGGTEALHLPGKRVGDVLCERSPAWHPAKPKHPGLERVVPKRGAKYRGNGNGMLEVYTHGDMQSPDYECGIWVPICKPEEENEREAAEMVSAMTMTGIL